MLTCWSFDNMKFDDDEVGNGGDGGVVVVVAMVMEENHNLRLILLSPWLDQV